MIAPTRTAERPTAVHRSDPRLVEAALRGEQRAWDAIVDRYGRLVYSIARRYGLGDADADDVFQNVFLILHRRLETLADRERLSSWLITTTHRECWRVGRAGDLADEVNERIENVGEPEPEDRERWERQLQVRTALDRLGGRCAQLLIALFTEEGTDRYARIADKLGMKVGSIGPTRARCFAKLEGILREMGVEAPAAGGRAG
jgi:RNA polymerase sigma factor (sigma-70 family)